VIKCNPVADADQLRTAMKGIGTDEATLIKILCNRNPAEIEAIKVEYLKKYSKDLIAAVKSETSGDFGRAMIGVLKDPRQYDADTLHDAMKGLGTDEFTLFSVLIGRNNAQLEQIKSIYARDHSKSLDAAVKSETSGDLQKLMLGFCAPRDVEGPVNDDAARTDAERLYNAGEGKIGTDEKVFIDIFAHRSWAHLRRVFGIYETIHKHHTIEHAVNSEFSGFLKQALHGVVLFARNPGEFYGDIAFKAMKGAGTDETMLTRVIVGNRDRMQEIKTAYSTKYNRSLWQAVNSEVSGDYKKTLLALIGN
jgi:hypothetical protein